jgi:GNAT superfamily N-acetyltransferase
VPFEWKVYGLDRPADLRARLEREGFVAGEEEAFMVMPVADHPPVSSAPGDHHPQGRGAEGGTRRRRRPGEGLADQDLSWLAETLGSTLAERPDELSVYCAYRDGEPVATGWTDFPRASAFADLHGGAVLPEVRGRGVYGSLFDVRLREAADRGIAWLAVDAAPMSRPLLLARGFVPVCSTVPMRRPM